MLTNWRKRWLAFIEKWRRQRVTSLPDLQIVLYSRSSCHLCECALTHLESARCAFGFFLEVVDIDTSQKLVKEYGEQVPVVTVNGKLRFKGRVNPMLLQRLLEAETAARRRRHD